MKIFTSLTLLFFVLLVVSLPVSALSRNPTGDMPWFTGPLIAPAADTLATGEQNFQPYLYITDNIGTYNQSWQVVHQSSSQTINPNLVYTVGILKFMDLHIIPSYEFNHKQGQSDSHITDMQFVLGFRILKDKTGTAIPDLRLTIGESFPTGRYNHVNPHKKGTDITGSGSYQTGFGIILQKLFFLFSRHYFRIRFSVIYNVNTAVHVNGFNAYGGGYGTHGRVMLGNKIATDLAFEYSFTRHWALAMDTVYIAEFASRFVGNQGVTATGSAAKVGRGVLSQLSLAPAIEYNFNSKLGIIGGVWFSVAGRDAADFISGVISLNYFVP